MSLIKVDNWLTRILPRRCVLCHQASGDRNVCCACRDDLPWIRSGCRKCGTPLPPGYGGDACGHCGLSVAAVQRFFSALIYEYPVDRLITAAKFGNRVDVAHALGELLGQALRERHGLVELPGLLIPVPLHRKRLGRRGYNQALEIARPLSKALDVPIDGKGCRRIRDTVEQTSLSGSARRRNMRGAFRIEKDFSGLHIALVDDVLTTGSTVGELAAALREAGSTTVQVWTVAMVRKV